MTQLLFDAVMRMRFKQIDMLRKRGVDIDTKDSGGKTCLMKCMSINNAAKRHKMFKFLLKRQADATEVDCHGTSVFQYACRKGDADLVDLVLSSIGVTAVNLLGGDKMGRTPLHYCVIGENIDIVKLVMGLTRERYHTIDIPDVNGSTPLIEAFKRGLFEIAELLQKEGRANPGICDSKEHQNAFAWAEEGKRTKREKKARDYRKRREKKLIFPPNDHARGYKSQRRKTESETADNVEESAVHHDCAVENRNSTPPALRHRDSTSSMHSALSLLEIASQRNINCSSPRKFIQSQYDVNLAKDIRSVPLNDMFRIYSHQHGKSFRKKAQLPKLKPKAVSFGDNLAKRSKISTFAIIKKKKRKMLNEVEPLPNISEGNLIQPNKAGVPSIVLDEESSTRPDRTVVNAKNILPNIAGDATQGKSLKT